MPPDSPEERNAAIFVSVPFGPRDLRDWRTGIKPLEFSPRLASRFVHQLCREIELRARELEGFSDLQFTGVYLGGCGASLLSLDQIYRILQLVCDSLPVKLEEQGLLVLPDSIREGKAKVLRESGFDRVEMRVRAGQQCSEDFELLRAAGFASVGFEIGYSAEPGWEEWLGRLLELKPDTVVFYVPESFSQDRLLTAMRTVRHLIKDSLRCFLLHHHCRAGKGSRLLANLCGGEVVGFGPGAETIIRGQRQQNEMDIKRYLRRLGRGDIRRPVKSLTQADALLGRLLRLEGVVPEEIAPDSLARLIGAGLLRPELGRLQLSEQGSVAVEQVRQMLMGRG